MRHPNVCEIYELCDQGQTLFLVMEWVDGDSLFRMLKASGQIVPISPRIAALIGAETCAGLHAAHSKTDPTGAPLNIVHRDVSPHNILLSADGIVKITDFGVAKAAGQMHDETVAGQLKGKLEYMSPEQVQGERVDRRTDVFGIGGVIVRGDHGTPGVRVKRRPGGHDQDRRRQDHAPFEARLGLPARARGHPAAIHGYEAFGPLCER